MYFVIVSFISILLLFKIKFIEVLQEIHMTLVGGFYLVDTLNGSYLTFSLRL